MRISSPAISMSYDDLKVIEAKLFLQSVAGDEQVGAGVQDALSAARVVEAMHASNLSGGWESVVDRTRPAAGVTQA
jgi:hypothetical protein